jgi:hypothetical protein
LTDNDCEYLTARVLYTHTPLPVRSITFMHTGVSYREGCLYDTVGKTMVGAVQITPAPAAPPAVASGPAITSVAAIEAGIYILCSVGSVYAREKRKSDQTSLAPILNIWVIIVGG